MSNPTFRSGPITFAVKEDVTKFRLVQVDEKGVSHATASSAVFGAVTENGAAAAAAERGQIGVGYPTAVAVHIGPATVPLEVDGGDATAIKQGAPVYAAADGKVSASGTVLVGVAARNGEGKLVRATLLTPVVAAG